MATSGSMAMVEANDTGLLALSMSVSIDSLASYLLASDTCHRVQGPEQKLTTAAC